MAPSAINANNCTPRAEVLARLLALPASASAISAQTVERYAVRPQAISGLTLTLDQPGIQGIGADCDGA